MGIHLFSAILPAWRASRDKSIGLNKQALFISYLDRLLIHALQSSPQIYRINSTVSPVFVVKYNYLMRCVNRALTCLFLIASVDRDRPISPHNERPTVNVQILPECGTLEPM
jgi:hypothetical protein